MLSLIQYSTLFCVWSEVKPGVGRFTSLGVRGYTWREEEEREMVLFIIIITTIDSITRRRKFIISNSFFKSEKPGNKPAVKKHINSITALQSGKTSGLGSQISLAQVSAQTYPPQKD